MTTPPPYYPVFLDLRGKRCVVIGGGKVARRKVEGLLEAGAEVIVIAPRISAMPDGVQRIQRAFTPGDLDGAMLVIASTDNPAVNDAIFREATARGIWVNVVDVPENCTFILPSVVRRGALRIAISTGGASPVLAKRLRKSLEGQFGEEYGCLIDLLWRLRQRWEPQALAAGVPPAERQRAWERVLDLPLLELLRAGDVAGAEKAAVTVLEEVLTMRL
ncbi:MAG TPA: bifunctional precorrin-2 dehydrogenase/sirohydrochlorin ferrochelatase [Armatimonadota bacterium]|jgi:precorrin-2 dehydrogenase/sirohydrochlorin ferrochelatase